MLATLRRLVVPVVAVGLLLAPQRATADTSYHKLKKHLRAAEKVAGVILEGTGEGVLEVLSDVAVSIDIDFDDDHPSKDKKPAATAAKTTSSPTPAKTESEPATKPTRSSSSSSSRSESSHSSSSRSESPPVHETAPEKPKK